LIAPILALISMTSIWAAPEQSPSLPPSVQGGGVGAVCRLHDGLFTNGPRGGDELALTFDLCPTRHIPPFADKLIAYLKREHVPATFFVSGAWARANPKDLRLLIDPLFQIALHGDRHRHLRPGHADVIRAEIKGDVDTLNRLGVNPVALFRPPYGDVPPELSSVARSEHVLPVLWDVELGDPNPKISARIMEREALRWVQAGSIIVLHANGRGIGTPQAVGALVPVFRKRGYVFVHVSDLIADCGVSAPLVLSRRIQKGR
jgi:peptidoglycan/xylan/chitin deacetylase (PgdA/CDA1 family)